MNHSELSHMAGAVDDSTIYIVVVIIIIIIDSVQRHKMSDKPNVGICFSEQKRLESSAEGRHRDGADVTSGGRQFHT